MKVKRLNMKNVILFVITLVFMVGCNKDENDPNTNTSEPISVYINSVTASPTASESVTIKNNSGSSQDLSGWKIGDENNPNAYNIPNGTTLNQGAMHTFNASTMGFQINDSGETIYLKNASGGLVDTWYN